MPFLPINQKLFANVDEVGNTVAVTSRIDVALDDLQNNEPRFRLALFGQTGVAARIDGIFRLQNYDFEIVVCGGLIFKATKAGVITEIPGTGVLKTNSFASLADFGSLAYVCNNSHIIKIDLDALTRAPIADDDAPKDATRVAFFDQYLLASIEGGQRFEWADVGQPDVWLGEFASAEARPDNLVGLYTGFGEIFLPGTATLEYWSDIGDDLSPFSRLGGTMTERGVLAPDSVVLTDNTYFFLDQERRVIRLEGRAPKVVSNPYDKEIQALSVVTDAVGFSVEGEGKTLYVISFPTAGRTFAYNYKLDDWFEASWWNDEQGIREAFLASTASYNPTWRKTLLGSRKADGKIYYATTDIKTDDGAPVRGEIITGQIDWKKPGLDKRSVRLALKLKRGTSGLEGNDSIFIYFRDDGRTDWGHAIQVDLGKAGDEYAYVTINRLGRYKSRQWRFVLPSVDTVLVSAEEIIEV